jgi:mRNA interferase MazF
MNVSNTLKEKVLHWFSEWGKLKVRLHFTESFLYFRERQIWWASLGANIGHEQDGKNKNYERPILILRKFNKHVLWALPLTSTVKESKYYFSTYFNGEHSAIILSQLKLISSKRLRRYIRTLPICEFEHVRELIKSLL